MKKTLTILLLTLACCALGQNTWVIQSVSLTDTTSYIVDARLQDEMGNILEQRQINYGSNSIDDWTSRTVFIFESKKLTRTELFNKQHQEGKEPYAVQIYQFDKDEQKSNLTIYNLTSRDSSISLTKEFKYESDTNLIQEISTRYVDYMGNQIEPVKFIIEYKYNDKGQKIEEWAKDSEEKISDHYSFKYDQNGNLIEKRLLDEIDYLEKTVFTYKFDSQGRLESDETKFNNGQVFRRHKYVYNKDYDLKEVLEYCSETESICGKIIYEYRKEK